MRLTDTIEAYCNPETAKAHGTKCGPPLREGKPLKNKMDRQKGFTYSLVHKSSPKEGYALSVFKHSERMIEGKPTANHISKFIQDHRDHLTRDPRMHVGGWYNKDDKKTYLDVSLIEKDKKEALRLAQKHKQLAIFDLKNKKTINTPKAPIQAGRDHTGHHFYFKHDADPGEVATQIGQLDE